VPTQDPSVTKYNLGYARISLANAAPWRAVINRLDKALEAWLAAVPKDDDGIPLVNRQRTRGPVSMACECTPETLPGAAAWPRIIRAAWGSPRPGASGASTAASCSRSGKTSGGSGTGSRPSCSVDLDREPDVLLVTADGERGLSGAARPQRDPDAVLGRVGVEVYEHLAVLDAGNWPPCLQVLALAVSVQAQEMLAPGDLQLNLAPVGPR